MAPSRITTLVTVLLGCAALAGVAIGQEAEENPNAALLTELREAPAYKRSKVRRKIVSRGPEIIEDLVAVIERWPESPEDALVTSQCILALGEIGDAKATPVLLKQLEQNNLVLAYHAAVALGNIWDGKGRDQTDNVKALNARLLAAMHCGRPLSTLRGSGLALARINVPNLEFGRFNNTKSAGPLELRQKLDEWFAKHPDRLPPLAEQPWSLQLHAAMGASDPELRGRAATMLLESKTQELVDLILENLADKTTDQAIRDELGSLLSKLTSIAYPPQVEPEEDPASKWRELWFEALKGRKGDNYVAYSWNALERYLHDYYETHDEKVAERITELRVVLMHQLAAPDSIPETASGDARELLKAPLESKQHIAEAVEILQQKTGELEKTAAQQRINRQLHKAWGNEMGKQFLQEFVDLASAEEDEVLARPYGDFLGTITDIPCQLRADSQAQRREALKRWVEAARKRGYSVKSPG